MKPFLLGCGGVIAGMVILGIVLIVIVGIAVGNDPETRAIVTGDAEDVTVRVEGDAEPFSGSIGSLAGQRSVDGNTPATFTIEGEDSSGVLTVVMQKQAEAGTLRVRLIGCPDGKEKTGETTAAYGVVTVSC